MLSRQRTGSVVCPSCGNLVGVNDERCYNCGRWNPGLWGFAPLLRRMGNDLGFTSLVVGGCAILYMLTLLVSGRGVRVVGGAFSFLEPATNAIVLFGASGAVPVFQLGWWWTIFSASWLHGSLLHIVFNMMWVRQLGPAVANLYGASRVVIIYTVAGAFGFLLSSVMGLVIGNVPYIGGSMLTLGASAAIFGLLGALVRYGHRTGSHLVGSQAWGFALTLFIFGFVMRGVDNWAHAGGFVGGYLAATALDPLRPERLEHMLIALACLGLTLFSVAASLIAGLRLIRGGM